MEVKLVVLLLGCLFACVALAKPHPPPSVTYYISTGGIDGNNTLCTVASPCQTIAYCLNLGPSGADLTISLLAGDYTQENCGVQYSNASAITYNSVVITGPVGVLPNATINCGESELRHFSFVGLAKAYITLSFLTLMKGNGDNGGCVYASDIPQLNLTNMQFTGCVAYTGGALYSDSITYISNSRFAHNIAGSEGGALYLSSVTNGSSISNTGFFSNTAGLGGAVSLYGGFLTFTTCNVSDNNATLYGGGLYLATPSPKKSGIFNFASSSFYNNTAVIQGGGLFAKNLNHTFNINGALFMDNWSYDLSDDSNIACNATAMEFCYACTAKDCVKDCKANNVQSCSQNSTSALLGGVLCYGSQFAVCKDSSCKCKIVMGTVEKVLIAVICLLLFVGVILITVDVVRHLINKRKQNDTYTPI